MARAASPRKASTTPKSLVVGWRVNRAFEPLYWLADSASSAHRPRPTEADLVTIDPTLIGAHTAIIAQSGSGKSFFLGRLIEEILLSTKSRCLVLDPNADFLKVKESKPGAHWNRASYDRERRRGFLSHEMKAAEFIDAWSALYISVRTRRKNRGNDPTVQQLSVDWRDLPIALLAEELEPALRSDLQNCHSFVQALADLFAQAPNQHGEFSKLAEQADKLLGKDLSDDDFRLQLQGLLPKIERTRTQQRRASTVSDGIRLIEKLRNESLISEAVRSRRYVHDDVRRYYFSRLYGLQAAEVIHDGGKSAPADSSSRLEVVDLASITVAQDRLMLVHAILTSEVKRCRAEWERALDADEASDDRCPTFVVVDEAHNLAPRQARSRAEQAVLEQLRTIVAEGRKYGLYVVLVTQRPDRIDPMVLGECENLALMRLSGAPVLDLLRATVAIQDVPPRLLESCLEFDTGRALICGGWAPKGPTLLYAAARRTVEGGRNLRTEFWARPA